VYIILDTAILKNYHAKLTECFPSELSAIAEAISTHLPDIPNDFTKEIIAAPDALTANRLLLNFLILQLNTGQDVIDLCEKLEVLVTDSNTELIEALRNGKHTSSLDYHSSNIKLVMHAWSVQECSFLRML